MLRVSDASTRDDGDALDAREWRRVEGRLRSFVSRRVGSPADVDDVLQDVFLRFQSGLASVRDDENLAPWLFAVARNVVTDHHRRAGRSPLAHGLPEDRVEAAPELVEPEDRPLRDELTACVARFVSMLPAEQREAITLVELEGMPQRQAADMLGISHSGLKSRVQRGRAELRRMFERACALELDARRRVVACEPRACGACGPGGEDAE